MHPNNTSQQNIIPVKKTTKKDRKANKQKNKQKKQAIENDKQQLISHMEQEMHNAMGFNMPPDFGQQHPHDMMPFPFEMCPHPMGQNIPFIGPPHQGQMMPFLPPHPAAQIHPHMMHLPHPVFDPQIMRDSSKPFVFKKKISNNDIDHKSKQMKIESDEARKQQLIYQVKQSTQSINCNQQQPINQSPRDVIDQEIRQQINSYQPLRQSVVQKKAQMTNFNESIKQNNKISALHFVTEPIIQFQQSTNQTPVSNDNQIKQQNLIDFYDINQHQAQNKGKQSASTSILIEKIEVKLPKQFKRKSVQKQKKKQIFVSSEKQAQSKLKLRLKSNDQEQSNQQQNNVQSNNQAYNSVRSNNGSKSPGIYQNQNSKLKYNQFKTNQIPFPINFANCADQPIQIQKMLSMPSQQNSKPLRIINRQSDSIFDYKHDKAYVDQKDVEKLAYTDENHLKIHTPLKSQNSYKSEQDCKQKQRNDEMKALTHEKNNFNNVFQFDSWNQAQPLSPFVPNRKNQQFKVESQSQILQNSYIAGDSIEQNQSISFFNKSLSLSQSINHPLSANCLRKCTQWQLTLCDQIKNPSHNKQRIKPLIVSSNSAVALRQMNYHFEEGLTKDELNAKKQRIQIPSGPQSFEYDIIDQMMMNEDQHIFDPYNKEFHFKHCPFADSDKKQKNREKSDINQVDQRDGPPEFEIKQKKPICKNAKCCQPQLKQFNFYNQRSYINQPIQLPFDMNQINQSLSQQSAGAFSQMTDENYDLMSQISSQLSERSKTGSQISQNNGGPSVKSSDTNGMSVKNLQAQCNGTSIAPTTLQQYNQLHIREQMLQILNVQQAENMMCLEFDLQDYPIVLPEHEKNNPEMIDQVQSNQRFRVINQSMIESMIHLRLKATCHGNTLFSPPEMTLNFNIQGKKLIKSIQDRILRLKEKLAFSVQQMQAQENGVSNKNYQQKYFLNMVEKNNRHGKGPWITQTKKSLVIKLLNFNGRSIAFQIAVPDLDNLPNLMTNFNQLVLREFVIEKIFVCFDVPLSKINSIQAQQIDVENYLTAKKINSPYQQFNQHMTQQNNWLMNSPATIFANGASHPNTSSQANDVPSSSQGTPIMNLLNVYQDMKADHDQDFGPQIEGNFEHQSDANQNPDQKSKNMHPVQTQINSIKPLKSCKDYENGQSHQESNDFYQKISENKNETTQFDLLKPQDHLAHPKLMYQEKNASKQQNKIRGKQSFEQFTYGTSTMNSSNSISKDQTTQSHIQSEQQQQSIFQNPNLMNGENFQGQISIPSQSSSQFSNQIQMNHQSNFGMTQLFYPTQNGNGQTLIQRVGAQDSFDNNIQQLTAKGNKGTRKENQLIFRPKNQKNDQNRNPHSNGPVTTINNYFSGQANGRGSDMNNMQSWYNFQHQKMINQHQIQFPQYAQPEIVFGSSQVHMQGFMPPYIPEQVINQNQDGVNKLPQAIQQQVQPGYYSYHNFLRDDRSQMCNLDRFLTSSMPINLDCSIHSISDLIKGYHKVSTNGVQVELFDDRSEKQQLMLTFTPTLSSIYLLTLSGKKNKSKDSQFQKQPDKRIQKVIEYHENQPHYKRKLLSHCMLEQTNDLAVKLNKQDLTSIDVSSSCSSYGSSALQSIDSSENIKKHQVKKDDQVNVIEEECIEKSISTEFSWFSILWTCQKQQPLQKEESQNKLKQGQQQNCDHSNVQFLVFYKFTDKSTLQIIGMLTSKLDREAFWLTPSQLCENEIEGQLFDEIYDNNIIRLQDMQEKCIKFMKDQGNFESSFDLLQILKGQQIESLSRDRANERFPRNDDGIDFNLHQVIQKMSTNLDSQPLYNQNPVQNQYGGIHNLLMRDNHMIPNITQFM